MDAWAWIDGKVYRGKDEKVVSREKRTNSSKQQAESDGRG